MPMISLVRESLLHLTSRDRKHELDLAFLTSVDTPIDQKGINIKLKQIGIQLGIPSLSFHYFRHTAATLWLKAGVPMSVVRDLLEHSSILLTTGTYDHAMPKAMTEAGAILNDILQ